MKVIILAGGMGTRISEETDVRPKPMVEIGGKPILWHLMKYYSTFGFNEFIILLGYKGYFIKEYFANYFLHQSEVTIHLENNHIDVHSNASEPWSVTLLDTGINTMTGGRIKKAQKYIQNEPFLLSYGDGLSDVNLDELIKFHRQNKKLLTLTSVQLEERFGLIQTEQNGEIHSFLEKPTLDSSWINGGFFVCEPEVMNYLDNDQTIFEQTPLIRLTQEHQAYAYHHHGFWKCMDTLRDKIELNKLWDSGQAKWKIW